MDDAEIVGIGAGALGIIEGEVEDLDIVGLVDLVACSVIPRGFDIVPDGVIQREALGELLLRGGFLLGLGLQIVIGDLQEAIVVDREGNRGLGAGGVGLAGLHEVTLGLLAVGDLLGAGDRAVGPLQEGVVVVVDTGSAAADITGVGVGEQKLDVLGGLVRIADRGGDGGAGELHELLLALGVVMTEEPDDVHALLGIAVDEFNNGSGVGNAVRVAAAPGRGGLSAVLIDTDRVAAGMGRDDDELIVIGFENAAQSGL